MKFTRALGVFVCLLGAIAATSGETPEPEYKTTAVAAFKNGLAFVVKQADVRLEEGGGRINPIPSATLGSLWLTPNDPGASLDELIAYRYKVPVEHNLTALADVLFANAGKVVTVGYNQREYTGEVVGFREEEPPPPEPMPPPPTNYGYPTAAAIVTPPAHVVPEYLLLKADDKLIALNIRAITQVTLPAGAVLRSKQEEERKALRFKLKGASGHANLTLGYLENGLGWTPSYMVTLQDDQTAQITMQAVLVDDAEDLKAADVFFVVGVPNFPYARIPSPMALQQTLMEFMQAASRRDLGVSSGGPYSNAIVAQRAVSYASDEFSISPSFATAFEELAGAPEEDLFLYSRSGVTLARNERATYNVFSSPVSFEHIYQWEVQEQPRVDGFGVVQNYQNYQNPGTSDRTEKNNIWHALRLKNSTKFPWTSAPAMVISGTKPLAQDVLPYTPKGAASVLKLTIATDLRASHDEQEVDRQRNIERRRGYSYDQVTVEGTLKIKNYKTKDVRLSIATTLRGNVDSQTDNGKSEKLAEAIAVDNPMSRLTWEITLKAGEEKTITYRYKVWVRV